MQIKAKRPLRVVIVGAGIGGLAAATALRQRGFEVALFERADKLEEVGAGLQIGPNGVRVMRALGLGDALRRNAFEPTNMVSLKWMMRACAFANRCAAIIWKNSACPT
jgi:salicylate hydroxylase